MNLNYNNHRITSSIIETNNNVKVILMGILLLVVATFLLTKNDANESATAFAQIICSNPINIAISGLPNQTAVASTQVALKVGSNNDTRGEADINIPGIGSGHVILSIANNPTKNDAMYSVTISNIPGQTGEASSFIPSTGHCPSISSAPITIPGIGSGRLAIG